MATKRKLPKGIDQLPSGRYRARFRDETGKNHTAPHTFENITKAKRWLEATRGAVVSGTWVDPGAGEQRVCDFAREWAEAQDWKETTRQGFAPSWARVEAVLPKNITLAGVDQLAMKRARIALAKKYAASTTTLSWGYLAAVMRAAYTTGRIPRDPTIGARTRRRRSDDDGRVGPDDVPTRVEVAAIWSAAPSSFRAAIALGATGLRVGEVLGLTADRVDVEHRLVTIDRQMQRIGNEMTFTTPKGETPRVIKLPSAVALELRRHLRDHDGGLLFVTGRTRRALSRHEYYAQAWRPALVGAGLDRDRFVFHSLRHFAASSMLAEGVNPMAVAGHLGDTLETMQRTYAHWMRDDRDVPADALDRILAVTADVQEAQS
jgi:integrase